MRRCNENLIFLVYNSERDKSGWINLEEYAYGLMGGMTRKVSDGSQRDVKKYCRKEMLKST